MSQPERAQSILYVIMPGVRSPLTVNTCCSVLVGRYEKKPDPMVAVRDLCRNPPSDGADATDALRTKEG